MLITGFNSVSKLGILSFNSRSKYNNNASKQHKTKGDFKKFDINK